MPESAASQQPRRRYPAPARNRRIGAVIRDARTRAGLKQSELGDELAVTQATVSAWERGQQTPRLDTFVELCAVVGIGLDEAVAGILEMATA